MNATPASGSGVPAVLREWLPATFQAKHPATVECIWAAIVALRNGLATYLSAAYGFATPADETSPLAFLTFCWDHWQGIVMVLLLAWLKGHLAFKKAAAANAS